MKTSLLFIFTLISSSSVYAQTAAQVNIIEFGDFQCPYTERAIAITDQIKADYGSKVQITFKNFPLIAIHQNAKPAALAAICAGFQDQFQGMFNLLFANQANLGQTAYDSFAKSLGLDTNAFDTCLTSDSAEQSLDADIALGNTYKVSATPTFILSNSKRSTEIIGAYPYPTFKAQIDSLLAN